MSPLVTETIRILREPRYLRSVAAVTPEEWEAKAEAAPVNLMGAMQAHRALAASQSTILGIVCGALAASTSLDREGVEYQRSAAQ